MREAAVEIVKKLRQEYGDPRGDDFDDGAITVVAKVIKCEQDGYWICRALEASGWAPDAKMVEIMGQAVFEKHDALLVKIADWLVDNKIAPKLEVGQRVRFTRRGEVVDGEIAAVRLDEAAYVVRVESAGHVKGGKGTRGYVIPYEGVESALVSDVVDGRERANT